MMKSPPLCNVDLHLYDHKSMCFFTGFSRYNYLSLGGGLETRAKKMLFLNYISREITFFQLYRVYFLNENIANYQSLYEYTLVFNFFQLF